MPKGKLAAQASHASIKAYMNTKEHENRNKLAGSISEWEETGSTKIVLAVNSEEELAECLKKALQNRVAAAYIVDEGRTVFGRPTATCVGVGPAPEEILNELFGDLKLL